MPVAVVGAVVLGWCGRWTVVSMAMIMDGVADAAARECQGEGAEDQEQRLCSVLSHREFLSVWLFTSDTAPVCAH